MGCMFNNPREVPCGQLTHEVLRTSYGEIVEN